MEFLMPRKVNLKKIAQNNPQVDLEQIDAWTRLRKVLVESGLAAKRQARCGAGEDTRARIIDDAEDDPRLIRLQHE
jgi:hypothetical protein